MRDRGVIYYRSLDLPWADYFPGLARPGGGNHIAGTGAHPARLRKNSVWRPLSYMRTSHMHLLMDWRDAVVRHDVHSFKAFNGKTYP